MINMNQEETFGKFREYWQMAKENNFYSHEQVSMDVRTLVILDGNLELLKKCYETAKNNNHYSHEQVSMDVQTIALMLRQSKEGLTGLVMQTMPTTKED